MFQDSWNIYGTPRYPRKWIFYPRKRSWLPQIFGFTLLGIMALAVFGGA